MAQRFHPEHWSELEQAVFSWVRSQVPAEVSVIWAKPDAPSPVKPFVRIDMIVPPVDEGRADRRHDVAIEVSTLSPGAVYSVIIEGVVHLYTAQPADTYVDIRNGLVTRINADSDAVTASDFSAIVGLERILYLVPKRGHKNAMVVVDDKMLLKVAAISSTEAVATFSIDAASDDDQAIVLARNIEASLAKQIVLETLNESGWATVEAVGQRKPDTLVAAAWEQRAGFDQRLRCRTRAVEINDFIETVEPGAFERAVA